MMVKKRTQCDQVLGDISRITALVNGRLHLVDLHQKVDIFFYIDRSIQARELCTRLQIGQDAGITRQLAVLHQQITDRWAVDSKVLLREAKIVL